MAYTNYELKSALPNKSYNEDGTTTDLLGNPVQNTVPEYDKKQSLPNKWLNPDGSYSTLLELISGAIDTEIFVVVEELPEIGEPNKIYLVPNEKGELDEFCWVNNEWDPIGMLEFDLSQYSTTDEMNAAILAALNQGEAYTDEQIAGLQISPQVFYWNGSLTTDEALAYWNNLLEINKTSDIIVYGHLVSGIEAHVAYITKGVLHNNATPKVTFVANQPEAAQDASYSHIVFNCRILTFTKSSDAIIRITSSGNSSANYYLAVNADYSTPYTPQYPGSPATKKYVDDSITTNITNVLGGNY